MKIVCQRCEVRAAEIVCCSGKDAAAFCVCANCDFKLHATPPNLPLNTNTHHQRHLLSSPTNLPMCDACKMMVGFFFCLEERKMLCWECDVSKHVTAPKSAHQRIFLPGVKVGDGPHQPIDNVSADNKGKKPAIEDLPESSSHAQLIMSTPNEFFEFEGDDANGLNDWVDSLFVNEDMIVEGAAVEEGDADQHAEYLIQDFDHLVSDNNNNNNNSVQVAPCSLP